MVAFSRERKHYPNEVGYIGISTTSSGAPRSWVTDTAIFEAFHKPVYNGIRVHDLVVQPLRDTPALSMLGILV